MKKLFVLICLIIISVVFISCYWAPPPIPKFQPGEIVKHVIYEKKGIVLRTKCEGYRICVYDVRFIDQRTSTPSLNFLQLKSEAGQPPFCTIKNIEEFELEKF